MRFPFLRRNQKEPKCHQSEDVSSLRINNVSNEWFDPEENRKSDQPTSQFFCSFDGGYEVTASTISPAAESVNPTGKFRTRNATPRMKTVADIRIHPRYVHELDDIPSPPRVTRKHIENRMEQLAELDRYIFSSWQLSDTSTESKDGGGANSFSSSKAETITSKRVKDSTKGSVMIKVMSLDSQSNAMSTIAEISPESPPEPIRSINANAPSSRQSKPSCDLSATTVSSSSINGNLSSDDDYGDYDNDDYSFSGYRNSQDSGINFSSSCIQPCGMVASDSLFLLEEIIRAATTPVRKGKFAR